MTLLIILSKVSCEVTALGKDEVSNTSTKAHSKEQPSIECHDNEHKYVAITNLHHMNGTLKNVHAQAKAVVTKPVTVRVCVYTMDIMCTREDKVQQ